MSELVRRWLGWWRTERIDLRSPLSADELAVRMSSALKRPRIWSWPGGEYPVVGRASPRWVSVAAMRRGDRNSFRPFLIGRLVREPDGG